jgi:hypothetical protein
MQKNPHGFSILREFTDNPHIQHPCSSVPYLGGHVSNKKEPAPLHINFYHVHHHNQEEISSSKTASINPECVYSVVL